MRAKYIFKFDKNPNSPDLSSQAKRLIKTIVQTIFHLIVQTELRQTKDKTRE